MESGEPQKVLEGRASARARAALWEVPLCRVGGRMGEARGRVGSSGGEMQSSESDDARGRSRDEGHSWGRPDS